MSNSLNTACDQHVSMRTCWHFERVLQAGSSTRQDTFTVLLYYKRSTHRKQNCNIHFADDSANTSKHDILRSARCTGRTSRENTPLSVLPESRSLNPLHAFRLRCRFHFLAVSKDQRCKFAMDDDFCCSLCKRGRGWRSFYFTVSLSVIGYWASTKMKKFNPFRELMMSPRIKNTFQRTGKSHACQDHTDIFRIELTFRRNFQFQMMRGKRAESIQYVVCNFKHVFNITSLSE